MPASRRGGASFAKPRLMAILSAVLKPIPSISRATRYGSWVRTAFACAPYCFTSLTHWLGLTP